MLGRSYSGFATMIEMGERGDDEELQEWADGRTRETIRLVRQGVLGYGLVVLRRWILVMEID